MPSAATSHITPLVNPHTLPPYRGGQGSRHRTRGKKWGIASKTPQTIRLSPSLHIIGNPRQHLADFTDIPGKTVLILVLPTYSCDTNNVIDPIPSKRPATRTASAEAPSAYIQPDVLDNGYNAQWRKGQLAGPPGAALSMRGHGTAFVEIEGYVSGMHAMSVGDVRRHFSSHWKAAAAAQRNHLPEGEIVGWYLASADAALALDRDVLLLHNTFFSHPWQVCLLLRGDQVESLQADGDGLLSKVVAVIEE